ncbi:DUF3465 domain-containing protein [Shewanella sedimentimangrovi]|uniref:DUF3465 domain-containing protein n=1 Tax=Shewanella sedimentimangrovi TaxID=2814293 RepID=A0ABX7R4C2_9GAMM|nr:DUF3465 domain-containing protein [Shewanella sedimentimangrovi]
MTPRTDSLNRILILCIALFAVVWTWHRYPSQEQTAPPAHTSQAEIGQTETDLTEIAPTQISSSDAQLARAFANRQSQLQVQGEGEVIKLLADDNEGSRHQRFIIRLASGQTLLIAHNIDLAPRLAPLKIGDWVSFYGQYEWNPKGGVIHWTHADPKGHHSEGWLKYKER